MAASEPEPSGVQGETGCSCPFLPRPLWALVIRSALAAAALDGAGVAVLRTAATMLATSRHVAAAAREVPLSLDLRQAPEADLTLLLPLLAGLPLRALLLAPRHAAGAEALLRCDRVAARSATSLEALEASVACTDTLQRYPHLTRLHLHAGVLDRLYPAVLLGLPALRHLGLHGYREADLAALPPSLAASLQVLQVTPRPEAMRCQLGVWLPPALRLRRLTVRGSFHALLSAKAAPTVAVHTLALCRQCEEACIEARQVVWQLPASFRREADIEAALAAALLQPGAAWRRLEVSLLEGAAVELPPTPGPAGLPILRAALDLERLVQAVQRLGGDAVQASLRCASVSIFHPWVLELQRRGQGGSGAAATAAGRSREARPLQLHAAVG